MIGRHDCHHVAHTGSGGGDYFPGRLCFTIPPFLEGIIRCMGDAKDRSAIGTSNALFIDLRTAEKTAVLDDLPGWIGDAGVEVGGGRMKYRKLGLGGKEILR